MHCVRVNAPRASEGAAPRRAAASRCALRASSVRDCAATGRASAVRSGSEGLVGVVARSRVSAACTSRHAPRANFCRNSPATGRAAASRCARVNALARVKTQRAVNARARVNALRASVHARVGTRRERKRCVRVNAPRASEGAAPRRAAASRCALRASPVRDCAATGERPQCARGTRGSGRSSAFRGDRTRNLTAAASRRGRRQRWRRRPDLPARASSLR